MLGTSPETHGGISAVVKAYRSAGLFERWSITYIETHCDGGAFRKLRCALSAWFRFLAVLIRDRNCLLHVHGASRASFWRKSAFLLPAIWLRVPFIFHLHGGGFMQFYGDECGRIARAFVRYVLDKSAVIVVLSESWRDSIRTIASSPDVVILPNPGPSPPMPVESIRRDPASILFLGRICKEKGVYVLLDAFARVLEEFPQAELICAGDGELEKLGQRARELGIDTHIKTPGWIDEEQRTKLLLSTAVFVLPSFTEGLPMSLLEAMSAAQAVVATPVGGVPDVITNGETGLLVTAGDAESLRGALSRLLGDPALSEEMGKRAQAVFRSRFDIEVVIPQLESIYNGLASR